jgi:hypothetical protein
MRPSIFRHAVLGALLALLMPTSVALAEAGRRAPRSEGATPPATTAAAPAAVEPAPPGGGSAAADATATGAPSEDPEGAHAEVIVIEGRAPREPGAVAIDAEAARQTPGAMGEPLRALAMLPGVATSVAAVGYPVIRGTMPGESRYVLDGIEIPMLYHLLLGNQVIHPSFLGTLELRAGGYGAEHGHLLGGLVTLTPAPTPARPQTELRATPVEVGAFHAQQLTRRTSIAAAARAGHLGALALAIDSRIKLAYVDQQARVVHRLGNGDDLIFTSLGAYDFVRTPPDLDELTFRLGYHRFDARWQRGRGASYVRAGVQSELDVFDVVARDSCLGSDDPLCKPTEERRGATSAGARPYVAASAALAGWLTLRGGADARARLLDQSGVPAFDPELRYLRAAQRVTRAGAWVEAAARAGRLELTSGVRADTYRAGYGARSAPRRSNLDPRLALSARLSDRLRAEVAGGAYAAPPQATIVEGGIAIGPLPATDGAGAGAGLSSARQAQASIAGELGRGWDASLAAYARRTRYAIDFGMVGKNFAEADRVPCGDFDDWPTPRYYDRKTRVDARGIEAMLRRDARAKLSGWISYSLTQIDRRLPIGTLPHDYDQRHTLNAALQARAGRWTLGVGSHLHTGRPALYPSITRCMFRGGASSDDVREDPAVLRRLPMTWRVDVRAERLFRFSGWRMRLFFELQNAALRPEALGYEYKVSGEIGLQTMRLPVPAIGLDAEL